MNATSIHNGLIVKKQRLQEITASLKDRFLGLDGVIGEVISLMGETVIRVVTPASCPSKISR
jgi:hypothetical protein